MPPDLKPLEGELFQNADLPKSAVGRENTVGLTPSPTSGGRDHVAPLKASFGTKYNRVLSPFSPNPDSKVVSGDCAVVAALTG